MTDILKQFEQTSNKAFNEIDDEALGQLGSELDRMRSVQEQIKLTELKVKNLKDEEQTLADSITDLLQKKNCIAVLQKKTKKLHTIGCVTKVMVI